MKPLTKEQLYQEAEQEWRLYFDNDNPLPSPMSVFIDGSYATTFDTCLGEIWVAARPYRKSDCFIVYKNQKNEQKDS